MGDKKEKKSWFLFVHKRRHKGLNETTLDHVMNFTILFATSLSLRGRRLVLWLMARLLMCLGSAPNTWLLPVVLVTAFNIALTSAALALAKAPAVQNTGAGGNLPYITVMLYCR